MKKIVLAYSGGLDTSIILKWLQENYKAEVIAYTADIGQEMDKKKIIRNAKKLGVKKIIIKNLNSKKRPISAVADNIEVRNAKKITIKTNKNIKFNLLYDKNRSLQKKIKIEQIRRETS